VFPPEPPVARLFRPERSGADKGAPAFGAAKRTLVGEHRSGIDANLDGRLGGNTFLLVSLRAVFKGRMGIAKGKETAGFVPL
jgi:hypothetical protein